MKAHTGRFITVEGVEGAGKSTNIAFLCGCLNRAGIDYVATREPGGTILAEAIRTLLLDPQDEPVNEMSELLMVFAARAQHLAQLILPTLAAGKWVVCDRFTDATYAYQGGGRNMGRHKIQILEELVQGNLRPDRTFFLDIPVEQGRQRILERGDLDRFEQEKTDFFERVRKTYMDMVALDPQRYCVIDASLPLDQVQSQIQTHVDALVENL